MAPEIRAKIPKKVVCGTYNFLGEPGKFMKTCRKVCHFKFSKKLISPKWRIQLSYTDLGNCSIQRAEKNISSFISSNEIFVPFYK